MELSEGWYKVKIEDRWFCAFYDKTEDEFSISIPCCDYIVWYKREQLDQIGDKIEFEN